MAKAFGEDLLEQMSPEDRLRGLTLEDRLRGLTLEDRLRGLDLDAETLEKFKELINGQEEVSS